MKARKRRVLAGFFVLGVCVVVVLAVVGRVFALRELRRQQAEERANFAPRPLVWAEVVERDLSRERRLLVRLEPWRDAAVAAEFAGVVAEVMAEPGQQVRTGEVLVRLDDALVRAELAAAEVDFSEAERLLAEAQKLAGGRVVTESELAGRQAARQAAAARLAVVRARLEKHFVRAPFDGVVRRRRVEVGEAVAPGQALVEVVELGRLRGVVEVAESELGAFSQGERLGVRVESQKGRVLEGVVRHVAGAADPATRLFRVELEVANAVGVPAGAVGEARVVIARWSGVPCVPEAAVRWEGSRAVVEVLEQEGEGSEVREVEVVLGPLVEGVYPVLEGLRRGERVVLR
jgi:RND family efflux transporter MFP subunit